MKLISSYAQKVRIGIATAKGLAFGNDIPLVTIPTLDVFADRFAFFAGAVAPIIDAKKNRFYSAIYKAGERTSDYLDISQSELLSSLSKHTCVLLTGPDCKTFDIEDMENVICDSQPMGTSIPSLISLGKQRYDLHGPDGDNVGPLYIRKSEAELSLQESSNA